MSEALAKFIVAVHRGLGPIRRLVLITFFGVVSECKHTPSCSEYFLQQVHAHGWRGWWRGIKRILTCV